MGLFDAGGPGFGLDDVKIAAWSSSGVYGTAVDVPSVQMYEIQYQTVNGQLEGDDVITDSHAKGRSAQVRLRWGSISMAALELLLGQSKVTSTGTRTFRVGKPNFPYFGVCGRQLSTQDDGDTHIFVPKMKLMEGFTFSMQYGQYIIPEITGMAVYDTTYQAIFDLVEHDDNQPVTLPPNYAV